MSNCSGCGAAVNPSARICEFCGAALIDVSMGSDEVALVRELETLKPALLATAYIPTTLEGQQAAFDQAMRRTRLGTMSGLSKKKRLTNGQLLDRAELLVDVMQANVDPEAVAAAQKAGAALAASRKAQKKQTIIPIAMGVVVLGFGILFFMSTMKMLNEMPNTLKQINSQVATQQAEIEKGFARGSDPKGFESARTNCAGDSKSCDASCQLAACEEACTTFSDSDSCTRRDTLACLGHKTGCDEVCQLAACSAACKAGASEACEQRKKIMGE